MHCKKFPLVCEGEGISSGVLWKAVSWPVLHTKPGEKLTKNFNPALVWNLVGITNRNQTI
jgi:hypothetical protein